MIYKSISATLFWSNIETGIAAFVKACPTYQRFKKEREKYRKIPPKTIAMIPWETVYVYTVDPYTVTDKVVTDRRLSEMAFIDPSTGWFEITEILDESSVAEY